MKTGRRMISFALWGADPFYNQGAVENARLARLYYPGWTCRFYCGAESPAIRQLLRAGCEVVVIESAPETGLFWRFWAAAAEGLEHCIVRDCDSRLNPREAAAVSAWIKSGTALHTMHDHEQHVAAPILGGMWGVRGGILRDIQWRIEAWRRLSRPVHMGPDQDFLRDEVWPQLAHDHLGHARADLLEPLTYCHGVTSYHSFPSHAALTHGTFVGEPIDVAKTP